MRLTWYFKEASSQEKKTNIETSKYYRKALQEASKRFNPWSTRFNENRIIVISHHTLLIGTSAKKNAKGFQDPNG